MYYMLSPFANNSLNELYKVSQGEWKPRAKFKGKVFHYTNNPLSQSLLSFVITFSLFENSKLKTI